MPQVIKDLEEALKREVSSLTTFHPATKTNTTIRTTFDPITGDPIQTPLTASFYSENSSPNSIRYPRIDIKFDLIQEDRTSGRMISIWEDYYDSYRILIEPNKNRPKVYEAVFSGKDGVNEGDGITIPTAKIAQIKSNHLVKIVSGNNKGTYHIKDIDLNTKKVTFDEELVKEIQEISYNPKTRKLYILNPTDIFTVEGGDYFVDSLGQQFKIINTNTKKRELTLSGGNPNLGLNSKIVRIGNVLRNADETSVFFIVMDPEKPLFVEQFPNAHVTDQYLTSLPATPFNYTFTLEVKNKERLAHIEIADRITETIINRPRRAIQVLLRCHDSAESTISCGSSNGNGRQLTVTDAKDFCVNDSVFFANKFTVSENNQIIDIDYETNLITLRNKVSPEFSLQNEGLMVSNASLKYWSLFLNDGSAIISQDSVNSFYRQEYILRIEGWKSEKTGKKAQGSIQDIGITLVTPNRVEEEF
jgi:hypothetical protein